MSLIITKKFKREKAQDAAAKDKAPDGWWEGKTIFAAFGWGKSVKGKVVSHRGGVIKLEDGTQFKESDAYDLYAIDSSASDAAELKNALVEANDACGKGEDAGVPNDLLFAVGAIENAIERYSKTFSRYEDDLEEKDFKRYNAIFHAAVNMHRAIQSA